MQKQGQMPTIGVIGLGAMGLAIAAALRRAGLSVIGWNRGEKRRQTARGQGIECADSLAELVPQCGTLVVCIADYASTELLFSAENLRELLSGRTLVQFSTGTPDEVREAEAFATAAGMSYLDGAILAYPSEVGDAALIAVSGPRDVWRSHAALFDALSGDVRYLGDQTPAAAALDIAVLSFYASSHLGLVHGALIAQAEGLDITDLTGVLADSAPSDSEELRRLGIALKEDRLDEPGASIGVYNGVLERILKHAESAAINDEVPRFVSGIYRRGVAAGLADKEVIALLQVLRHGSM